MGTVLYEKIETVYTLKQAEKILNRRKLSRRIKRTLKRLIRRYRTEIKCVSIGIILALAFFAWLFSTGEIMDSCIYIGSIIVVVGIANI